MNYPYFVSVIMPVRNERNFIEKSLTAVLNQDYPAEKMEIVVLDGLSDDGTRDVIEKIKNQSQKFKIFLIDNQAKIVPKALNIGLKYAKGDIIIRVDGHTEIAPDYVRRCVEALEETKADCAGGYIVTVGETLIAKAISFAQSSPFGAGGITFRVPFNKGRYVNTLAFGAYKREVFTKIGTFDEELVRNQDDEFNFRLIQAGGKIWLDPKIKSKYYCRSSLFSLAKQYFEYGFWKVRVFQKRGKIFSYRQIIPSIFVLSIIFSTILSLFIFNFMYFLVPLLPYLILNLFFSILASRKNLLTLPLLPICFFIIHTSYGLGFLVGLFKWRRYGFRFFKLLENKK